MFAVQSSIDLIDFLWHKNKSGLFYNLDTGLHQYHSSPGVVIYTVNCIPFGYKLIGKETLMGTQATHDILRKLKII